MDNWNTGYLKFAAAAFAGTAANVTGEAVKFAKENPGTAACYGAAGAAVVVAVAPAVVASPALAMAGFAADGVVKGSMAAAWQSGIGSVAAPSLFSTLQSAGAAGCGLGMVSSGVSSVSAAGGAAAAAMGEYIRRHPEDKDGADKGEGEGEGDKAEEGETKSKH